MVIIESRVDLQKGVLAQGLVTRGTLKRGDIFVVGLSHGKVGNRKRKRKRKRGRYRNTGDKTKNFQVLYSSALKRFVYYTGEEEKQQKKKQGKRNKKKQKTERTRKEKTKRAQGNNKERIVKRLSGAIFNCTENETICGGMPYYTGERKRKEKERKKKRRRKKRKRRKKKRTEKVKSKTKRTCYLKNFFRRTSTDCLWFRRS